MRVAISTVALMVVAFTLAHSALAGENAEKIASHFKHQGYQFGWSGGAANDERGKDVRFFKVTNVTVDGNKIEMAYDWKKGKIQGHLLKGHRFEGKWTQDGGEGGFAMMFDQDFERANGHWWNAGDKEHKRRAYLK